VGCGIEVAQNSILASAHDNALCSHDGANRDFTSRSAGASLVQGKC
jgi:hypothetical protein